LLRDGISFRVVMWGVHCSPGWRFAGNRRLLHFLFQAGTFSDLCGHSFAFREIRLPPKFDAVL